MLLRAGALPAPLTVVEQRSVGPELGADSIRAGAISLAVGFVLVIAFMAVFYGLFGWFANVCLVVNLVLMLGHHVAVAGHADLPGMAGILLTLGMAVDANILINERIREEQRNGRPPLAALEHGFSRAYSTIFDSNATAFLAHVMLFVFGSGPVKGFAVTITVGIATSLFTAWMLTRLLVSRWYCRPRASRCCRSEVRPCSSAAPCSRLRFPDGTRIQFMRGPLHGADRVGHPVHRLGGAVLLSRPEPGHRFLRRRRAWRCGPPGRPISRQIRAALAAPAFRDQGVQRFGDPSEVLIRLGNQPSEKATQADRRPSAGGAGHGGARREDPADRRGRRRRSAPSCSATACWRWASAC